MPQANCPNCNSGVHVDSDATTGDAIVCDDCGYDLEIVGLDPLELETVEVDEDDAEEDDDGW